MKKIIVIVIIIGLAGLITIKLMKNHEKINATKNISTDLDYVSVNVSPATKVSLDNNLDLTGYLDVYSQVDISSKAQGQIMSLQSELGRNVTKGSIIATIDDRLKRLAVQKAQNSLDILQKDLERSKNLYNGGSLTKQQLDDAQNNYDNAVIQLEQAKKELTDATIVSPIQGTIIKKYVEQGEFINIGSPIATVVDVSRLKIKLNVSETNIYQLHVGENATITTDVYQNHAFQGKISFVSPKGDDSHNYPVEVEMQNNPKFPLKSGTFATVHIDLENKVEGLCILREALQGSINDAKVYVARDGKAVLRKITVTNGNDAYLQVLSGLNEGEQVIINGQINLADGKAIKIIQ